MCGIAGIVHFGKMVNAPDRIRKMTNALFHRGPDAFGFYNEPQVSLGHRRLSIIDLDNKANQPFIDVSGRYVLCFNGEIYNYANLKRLLKDYPFVTNSDTEVLLAAFAAWGISCVDELDGMFAFSIWDKQTETLWLVRDRLGVKPMYYCKNEKSVLFASELRALLSSEEIAPHINSRGVHEYLAYQSISNEHPMVDTIQELKPGTILKITSNEIVFQTYWKPSQEKMEVAQSPGKIQQDVFRLLSDSISKRLVGDVPIASFLSGGMDSSAVVALMSLHSQSPLHTFTLGFSESEFDESSYASIIAKRFNTSHSTHILNTEDILHQVSSGLDAMDSPSADGINTYLLANAMKSANIKVALSGIGGDELFAGYPGFGYFAQLQKQLKLFDKTYLLRNGMSRIVSKSRSNKINKLSDLIGLRDADISSFYTAFRQNTSPKTIEGFMKNPVTVSGIRGELILEKNAMQKYDTLSQYSIAEYMGYSSSTLLKDADQMSMAVGLEIREPFFDFRLVEYMLALPNIYKMYTTPKHLLADVMEPLLPKEITSRKKKGFVLPWKHWMQNELFSFCESHLYEFANREFVQKKNLLAYWDKFIKSDSNISWIELWQFVVLNHWMNKNSIEYKA